LGHIQIMDSACVSTTIPISGFSALASLYCLHVQLGNKKTLLARKQQGSHRNIVKYRSIFELPAYKFHSPSVGIKISWYCDRWVGLEADFQTQPTQVHRTQRVGVQPKVRSQTTLANPLGLVLKSKRVMLLVPLLISKKKENHNTIVPALLGIEPNII